MNQQFRLPDGSVVGTGLKMPDKPRVTAFAPYAGPMYTYEELRNLAVGRKLGSGPFDKTWVKDQKSHGSCNGFMAASMLSKARFRRGLKRVDLGGAYIYSLINDNQDNGSMLEDGMRVIQERGCATEKTVGWDQIYRNRYDTKKADEEASNYKAFECYALARGDDPELEIFSAIAAGFDVGVAVHVTSRFYTLDSRGVCGLGNGPGNHAVPGDHYYLDPNTGELILDMPNSWNTTFGIDGRGGLTWKAHMRYTHKYHVFYAIRSTLDSKGDTDNPPVVA